MAVAVSRGMQLRAAMTYFSPHHTLHPPPFSDGEQRFWCREEAINSYVLHLTMAALVGASFVAVSAYYMHRKTLSQLLEFARAVEHERAAAEGGDENSGVGRDGEPKRRPSLRRGHQQHSHRKEVGYHRLVVGQRRCRT